MEFMKTWINVIFLPEQTRSAVEVHGADIYLPDLHAVEQSTVTIQVHKSFT